MKKGPIDEILRRDARVKFRLGADRGGAGELFLVGREREDRAPVLIAFVRPLTVYGRRVVYLKESLEETLIRDPRRVELDEHGLGVARIVLADPGVRRVARVATRVADRGGRDARDLPECVLHAPKTTCRERGELVPGLRRERGSVADVARIGPDVDGFRGLMRGILRSAGLGVRGSASEGAECEGEPDEWAGHVRAYAARTRLVSRDGVPVALRGKPGLFRINVTNGA